MTVKNSLVVLALLASCGVCHADGGRWLNFAEDSDLKYYLDQKSVQALPDNVYLFWVKSIAKDKNFLRNEYNMQNLSYVFTNYEMDCAVANYRVRGSIFFDKNRREINKILPASAQPMFEPVPPESMLELAQEQICQREDDSVHEAAGESAKTALSGAGAAVPKGAAAQLAAPELGDGPLAAPEETIAFEPAPQRRQVAEQAGAAPAATVSAEPADAPTPPPAEVPVPAAPVEATKHEALPVALEVTPVALEVTPPVPEVTPAIPEVTPAIPEVTPAVLGRVADERSPATAEKGAVAGSDVPGQGAK